MYHQLNIDRMTLEERFGGDTGLNYERKNPVKNKPVFSNEITAEISKKIVDKYEEKNPKFKEWAKDKSFVTPRGNKICISDYIFDLEEKYFDSKSIPKAVLIPFFTNSNNKFR